MVVLAWGSGDGGVDGSCLIMMVFVAMVLEVTATMIIISHQVQL